MVREGIGEGRDNMKKMRKEAMTALVRLASYSGQDGVTLALRADELSAKDLQSLDLFGVAAVKYSAQGGCEVKFFDRAHAAKLLLDACEQGQGSASQFLGALRESAAALGDAIPGEDEHGR